LTNEKGIFEADKERLLKEKNTLVNKRDKLKEQLVTFKTNVTSGIKPDKESLKAKKPFLFDNIKRTLQRFIIGTQYYQEFYKKDLFYNSNKI